MIFSFFTESSEKVRKRPALVLHIWNNYDEETTPVKYEHEIFSNLLSLILNKKIEKSHVLVQNQKSIISTFLFD